MTSLLTKLPSLGFRPAGGLSSRLGCHVLCHRGPNAVVRPWVTRRQMRFSSNDTGLEYKNPGHYATLGLETSASPDEIREALTKRYFDLHSDITGVKSEEATENFLNVQAAGKILKFPERKAKYDEQHGYNRPAKPSTAQKQPSTAGTQRGGVGETSSLLRRAASLRAAAEHTRAARARAVADAEAAKAKMRDEKRRAKEVAESAARMANAERQRAAEEEKKKAEEEAAAIRAMRAAEKKKADDKEAADRRKAAAQAIKARREREAREKRLVVLRHVPAQARPCHFTQSLTPFEPGRILDMGCGRGVAWVEFFTAQQARAMHRLIIETGWFAICGTKISNAEIRQGTCTPPQGPELITRSLRIEMPAEFLESLAVGENPFDLMVRKLRERRFWVPGVDFLWGNTFDGQWLIRNHLSVAHAKSAKAAIETYYPQLSVAYVEDPCGGLPQTAREDALEASHNDKKEPKASHWLAPRPFEVAVAAFSILIGVWMDMWKDESSDDKKQ